MKTQCFTYDALTRDQLYAILQLRQSVFIEEQQSIYPDIDGCDQQALHWCIHNDQELAAYARVRSVNTAGQYKIERVVNHPHYRGQGLAKSLMQAILEHLQQDRQLSRITLSAQLEVLGFYQQFGFQAMGEPYDDGGILHKQMHRLFDAP